MVHGIVVDDARQNSYLWMAAPPEPGEPQLIVSDRVIALAYLIASPGGRPGTVEGTTATTDVAAADGAPAASARTWNR